MSRSPVVRSLAIFAITVVACRDHAEEEAPVTTAVPVTLARVVRDSLPEAVTVTGRLRPVPGHDLALNAPAAGIVRRITVHVGDSVGAGQLVVALTVPELEASARQQAIADTQAQREAERQRQLFADGVTSRRQLEEAEAAARTAAATAAAARQLLSQTAVTSPMSGRVQEIPVQQGSRVDVGTRLAEVIASDWLDLSAAVPAALLARMRVGQAASISADGDTAAYSGYVEALAPAVDSFTNAGQALIRVSNPAGRLRAGASATAHIVLGVRHGALVVPDSAIVVTGDSLAVFVVGVDSVAHQRIVTIGARQGTRTEVRGAVQPGEAIVTTGAAGLQDGMRVVPASPPASPADSTSR